MSNYHIIQADTQGNRFTVVMHIPIPNQTNEVGVNYRTAVVEYQGGAPISSVLPSIGSEQTQLDAGELVERVYPFYSNPNETLLQKRDRLDTMFGEKVTEVQGELQKVLSYWGYSRDVP